MLVAFGMQGRNSTVCADEKTPNLHQRPDASRAQHPTVSEAAGESYAVRMAWVSKVIFWIVAALYAFGALVHLVNMLGPEQVMVTIALVLGALWLSPSTN